jgi:hypothetical protein
MESFRLVEERVFVVQELVPIHCHCEIVGHVPTKSEPRTTTVWLTNIPQGHLVSSDHVESTSLALFRRALR